MRELFESLNKRRRPEDVAQIVLEQLEGHLGKSEIALLQRAAGNSLKQRLFGYTSMLEEFVQPAGMERQLLKARELFASGPALMPEQFADADAIELFIRQISPEIRKEFDHNNFREDRLSHLARREAGLDLSRRRYNKLFRHLMRLEAKLHQLVREQRKLELTKIGKSALASQMTWRDFSANLNTACFIAYLTARSNLRSEFTISGQQRPYDEIADMLFSRCRRGLNTDWWAIAQVYPSREVLVHLTEEQKGMLLGKWFSTLQEIAGLLGETWRNSEINRRTMIVQPGNDSSTWNNTASAWNKARDHWIALLSALDMEAVLDALCFGKVLRLMAADVAAWHRLAGGGLDPGTSVWNELPLPWEVLDGQKRCPRELVGEVCRKYGVDPIKSGWTAAKNLSPVAAYRPTPELVHGVTVASPFLATVLRQAGYFSGKSKSV